MDRALGYLQVDIPVGVDGTETLVDTLEFYREIAHVKPLQDDAQDALSR
jgi:hypothetical protein